MQKIIIIALLCATAFAVAGTATAPLAASVGQIDGFLVTMGVSQLCHHTCKTCTGILATECATCTSPLALSGTKTCVCAANAVQSDLGTDALGVLTCSGTASNAAKCKSHGGLWFSTSFCDYCDPKCKECETNATTCRADAAAAAGTSMVVKGCWGALTLSSAGTCSYTAAKSYLAYSDLEFDQTSVASSALKGYFYDATTFTYTACAKGCEKCTSASAGCVCASGFTETTAKNACECSATGNFATAATATALDLCTACATGCTTCTSATVCSACDSSHTLGSTASSSECIANTTSDSSSSSSSTDGEKDGESSAATGTDATTTNGVLITAVSMLLAVILA